MVNDKWGYPVDLEKVEMALKKHPDASIVACPWETSTAESDVQNITKLVHEHGCMVIVDSVTGLVGRSYVLMSGRLMLFIQVHKNACQHLPDYPR